MGALCRMRSPAQAGGVAHHDTLCDESQLLSCDSSSVLPASPPPSPRPPPPPKYRAAQSCDTGAAIPRARGVVRTCVAAGGPFCARALEPKCGVAAGHRRVGGNKTKTKQKTQDYHGIKLPKLRDWCRNERLDESGTLDDLRYRHQK